MARQRLLFVAPVMPSASGSGLAMRAGLFLDALASAHDVILLVVPVFGPRAADPVTPFVADRAARTVVLPIQTLVDPYYALIARLKDPVARRQAFADYPHPLLTRFATSAAARGAAEAVAGESFDVVHVMRLYLAPFVVPYLATGGSRPFTVIDLDDDEVETRSRIAAVRAGRDEGDAELEQADSRKYAKFEREWLPRFDRVLVCAERDRAAIAQRLSLRDVDVVPNGVRIPSHLPERARSDDAVHRLLFVGSLGYFPNEDAAFLLCDEVLPRIRGAIERPVELDVVGARPSTTVRRLAERTGVRVSADVPDVTPFYRKADIVVTPIRAGGGTRIKLLEAFAHRVPVVSSAAGAEGLDVSSGRELLIADEPAEIAAACVRLLTDRRLAGDLAGTAAAFVGLRHDWSVVARDIARGHSGAVAQRHVSSRVHSPGAVD